MKIIIIKKQPHLKHQLTLHRVSAARSITSDEMIRCYVTVASWLNRYYRAQFFYFRFISK